MGAAKWSTQLISWLSTFWVARLLMPADYGLVAMGSIYLGLLALVSEFGIGTTVVSRPDLPKSEIEQLNTLALFLGVGSLLVSAVAAWPLGVFFRSKELPPLIIAMSAAYTINAFQVVPQALLRREMRFRTLALIDVARGFLVPAGTLVLALAGFRYWALAGGTLLSMAVSTAGVLINRRCGFARPRLSQLTGSVRFSGEVLGSRLAWFVYSNADFTVAGRRLGEVGLGIYSFAWTIAEAPIEKIYVLLADVTPALFAAVQKQRDDLKRYFLNMTELLTFAAFPAAIGLSVTAPDLVYVLLGPKWEGAVVPLSLLAAYSVVRSVTTLYGHLFIAVGETKFSLYTSVATAIVMPIACLIGSRWGPTGIAMAWLVVHPVQTYVTLSKVQRILDLRLRDYIGSLRLGIDGSIVMAVAVLMIREWLPVDSVVVRLIVEIVGGALVFIAVTLLLHLNRLKTIWAWFNRARRAA